MLPKQPRTKQPTAVVSRETKKVPRIRRKSQPKINWLLAPDTPDVGFIPIAQADGPVAYLLIQFRQSIAYFPVSPFSHLLFWTKAEAESYQRTIALKRKEALERDITDQITQEIPSVQRQQSGNMEQESRDMERENQNLSTSGDL